MENKLKAEVEVKLRDVSRATGGKQITPWMREKREKECREKQKERQKQRMTGERKTYKQERSGS